MTQKLRDLFELHGMMSLWKQRHLANWLGEHSWEFDAEQGSLKFPQATVSAQLLGEEIGTVWHWAWDMAEVPEAQLLAAAKLREFGEQQGIEEFTVSKIPLERISGHLLGLTALGVLHKPAYYRAVFPEKALLLVLEEEGLPVLPALPMTRFLSTVADAIQNYEFRNHKQALSSFVQQLEWEPQWEGQQLTLVDAQGIVGIASFDEHDRLAGFKTRQPEASLG
jgi:hypothetical protein